MYLLLNGFLTLLWILCWFLCCLLVGEKRNKNVIEIVESSRIFAFVQIIAPLHTQFRKHFCQSGREPRVNEESSNTKFELIFWRNNYEITPLKVAVLYLCDWTKIFYETDRFNQHLDSVRYSNLKCQAYSILTN